jgi:N-acetylglucosamine-6-phosphate deacetylase
MITALTNGTIFTGSGKFTRKALLFDDDGIKGVVDAADIPGDAAVVDCLGANIAPGLVDLQIYGAGGVLFSDKPSAEALQTIANAIVETGTTSFLLTLATNAVPVYRDAIHMVRYNPHPALLGLHLEGPYISAEKKGAHLEEFIKMPTEDEAKAMSEEAEGVLKMMTLAPEVTDESIIRLLVGRGITVSAGHSMATYEEGVKGFEAGITTVTHLFNAMSPLHHRATGLPGATLASTVYASIIADGIHVDYSVVNFSKKAMGERLFLITDAVAESTGVYPHVQETDRYTLPDGTLSGSNLTLLQAVKNCVQHAGILLEEALRMASTYPANLLHANEIGRLEPGAKANILLFDEDFNVQQVYLEGKRQ